MKKTKRNIEKYVRELPDEVRDDMDALHRVIWAEMGDLPAALFVGTFWGGSDQEIIGYGVDRYTRPNGTEVEWFQVGLARQKNYLSLYVNAVEDRKYLSETMGHSLGKVKVGKASISFKRVADIDLNRLRKLVRRARETYQTPG